MKNGYAICLNEWALDETIKNELGLLLIISSLCAKDGYCYASNEYLAEQFKTTPQTISRKLGILENKKLIKIKYERLGTAIKNREIRLTKMITAVNKNDNGTVNKNVKENNTSNINNININIKEIYKEIIDYLNSKLNTHYKDTTPKTQKLIKARLNEGFNVNDFKKVIDTKYDDWHKDKKMFTYLRPETLFSNKFENYLNQRKEYGDSREEILKYLEEMNKNDK